MFTWMKLRPLALMGTLVLTAGSAPAQLDRTGWQAELSRLAHDVRGVVTIVDSDTIRLDNFSYDGAGIEVYVVLADADNQVAFQNGLWVGPNLLGTVFSNDTLQLDLPAGETIDDYQAVSIWCTAASANFGSGTFQHPRTGWQAELSTLAHQVDGVATIVDHDTVRIDDFDYDGGGIVVYAVLGTSNTNSAFASGLWISGDLLGMPYSGATVSYDLPGGATVDGYQALSIWCEAAGANFGSGSFGPVFTLEAPQLIGGQFATLRWSGATPGGQILTGYSLNGGGPSNTPIGMVDLSLPIRELPRVRAMVNGAWESELLIPGSASGLPIWIQAYDAGSGQLSPQLMQTIL